MFFSSMGKRALDHGSGLSDWEAEMIAAQQPLIQEPDEPEPNRSIFGLDLGQLQDFAAFVLVEKIVSHSLPQSQDLVAKPLRYYNVRGIKRFPLGTSYPDIVERVKQTLEKPQYAGAPLVIDGTGVGVPVVDMFRKIGMSARIRPVQIIAGQTESSDPTTGWNKVSKIVLMSTLIALLQSRRIFWADGMPERIVLERELQDYRLKVTKAANETFDAKAGAHDDLVMALALACWYGERGQRKVRIGA